MTEPSADLKRFLGSRGIEQATHTLSPTQKVIGIALVMTVIATFAFGYGLQLLFYINAGLAVFFLIATLYRVLLIDLSLRRHHEIHLNREDLVHERENWPHYVIQVPLYKESRAIPRITKNLSALDYPKEKLTIQLLVEADDEETRSAIDQIEIRPPFKIIDIPVSYPRTKPKACNVGLAQAEGDFLVIYDAEDRPEPDQLKKAVLAFDHSPREVACIQAKLNFYNSEQNLLSRCFTAEYTMWFDLCLPGLDVLEAPIPLGGTSNHFNLSILKQLSGWDEYNVTEDCDLGLRLFSAGYRTRMLDSTTWEEACCHLSGWYRQRSRWVKGYVQTYLVHTRHLGNRGDHLGLSNNIHFHLLLGGSVLSQLLAPIYWSLVLLWVLSVFGVPFAGNWLLGFQAHLSSYFPLPVFAMASMCLFFGNALLVYSAAIACAGKGLQRMIPYTLLLPFYWLIMSAAAWKGTLQLIWNPHYWEKTQHYEDSDKNATTS